MHAYANVLCSNFFVTDIFHRLSMTFRTPTNVIDRRQLTYTTSTAIGRFNVNLPRLEACRKSCMGHLHAC